MQNLLTTSIESTFIALMLSIVLAVVWYYIVRITATSFVYTQQYLGIFLLLIPTMVLIITIIKASLALSLGLVGALSIVRFRTPIKDPFELMYIFVAIALGLGLGAGHLALTSGFLLVLCIALLAYSRIRRDRWTDTRGMLLELTVADPVAMSFLDAQNNLVECGMSAEMQRMTNSPAGSTYVFKVSGATPEAITALTVAVRERDSQAAITVFNNEHIIP